MDGHTVIPTIMRMDFGWHQRQCRWTYCDTNDNVGGHNYGDTNDNMDGHTVTSTILRKDFGWHQRQYGWTYCDTNGNVGGHNYVNTTDNEDGHTTTSATTSTNKSHFSVSSNSFAFASKYNSHPYTFGDYWFIQLVIYAAPPNPPQLSPRPVAYVSSTERR